MAPPSCGSSLPLHQACGLGSWWGQDWICMADKLYFSPSPSSQHSKKLGHAAMCCNFWLPLSEGLGGEGRGGEESHPLPRGPLNNLLDGVSGAGRAGSIWQEGSLLLQQNGGLGSPTLQVLAVAVKRLGLGGKGAPPAMKFSPSQFVGWGLRVRGGAKLGLCGRRGAPVPGMVKS